jgi:hypothetical protein
MFNDVKLITHFHNCRHQIRVVVLDINDNSPTFPESKFSVSYDESDPPGTRVILDTATDPDEGPNGTVTDYRIASGDPHGRFSVTLDPSTSSVLYLQNTVRLNRSVQSLYSLNVSCHDLGNPYRYGFLIVNVTVVDANDHPPVFDAAEYHVVVNESAPFGSFVVRVHATDADVGPNAAIVYTITDGNPGGQFNVDGQTGVITTAVNPPLYCSSACDPSAAAADPTCRTNACVLTVEAKDGGQPHALSANAQVSIVVADVNDQPPVISFRNRVSASQPLVVDADAAEGAIVEAVSVTDADAGSNGQTSARVAAGNERGDFVFAASPISGLYFLRVGARRLVPEARYNLTIEASDAGTPPRSAVATLLITVGNANAAPPAFDASFYSAAVSEIAPVGSYVVSISARSNGNVTYSIASGNYDNWFGIDSATGLIQTKNRLNWQQRRVVSLIVQAASSSGGAATASANVTISILPGFRTAPVFSNPLYVFSNLPSAVQLGTVSASVETGDGGVIAYRLADHVQYNYPYMFQISRQSGSIVALRSLTVGSSYSLVVEAVNLANLLEAQCTVVVNVTAAAFNQPPTAYPSIYFARLATTVPVGSQVVQIRASDDAGGSLTYSLSSATSGALKFSIDSSSGWISTAVTLDARTVYSLSASVTDAGGLTSTAVVQVFISGSSTVRPVAFSQTVYSFSIVEDNGLQSSSSVVASRVIGQVSATADASSRVSYFIVDGDPTGVFAIGNATGTISTTKAVDRELKAAYNLTVVASTGSDFAVAFVVISVADLNDNPPSFLGGLATETEVAADAAVGQDFYVAAAVDPDAGVNGSIQYSLLPSNGSSSPTALFRIDPTSGLLRVAVPLRQLSADAIIVRVVASNLGVQPLTSVQTVTVHVMPSNDNTPTFNTSEIWISVDESTSVNTRFFSVASALLTNVGSSNVSPLTVFTVARFHGINDGRIALFPDGFLFVAAPLDSEWKSEYHLTVLATDFGTLRNRSSTVDVIIVVADVNDHTPSFTNATYWFYVTENSPTDQFGEIIRADDDDRGRNGDVIYAIEGSVDGFAVDPVSGLLTALRVFDREQQIRDSGSDTVTFQVSATDGGLPAPRRGLATVHVVVLDINDESPVFNLPVYAAAIAENVAVNSTVLQVSAADPDSGRNGSVTYCFVDDGTEDDAVQLLHFAIDPNTGLVTVASPLDALLRNSYSLTVMARDSGTPASLNNTAIIVISIIEAFKRPPLWSNLPSPGNVSVGRRSPVGSLVTAVTAVSQSPYSGQIRSAIVYSVAGATSELPFTIERSTGRLFLNRSIDAEVPRRLFAITITAYDEAAAGAADKSPVASASTMLTIVVVDYDTVDTPQIVDGPTGDTPHHIADQSPAGSLVFVAAAEVTRLGVNARLAYSIARQYPSGVGSGTRQSLFVIDPDSGAVTASDVIDRDVADSYQLVVSAWDRTTTKAIDRRLTAEHLFSVVVDSADDAAAEFLSPSAVVLQPDSRPGSVIAAVRATDTVTGSSYGIKYAIVSDNSSSFVIDGDTGYVYVGAAGLPSSLLPAKYALTVAATVAERPAKSSSLQLAVIVAASTRQSGQESNNKDLVFSRSSYAAYVTENSPASTSIISVSASYGSTRLTSSKIEYYITAISGSVDEADDRQPIYFDVDSSSGLIRTTRPLDREAVPDVLYLQVIAVDVLSATPKIANTSVSDIVC